MKRSVNYAEVMVALNQGGINADTLNGIQVGFVNLLAYDLDQSGIALELDIITKCNSNLVSMMPVSCGASTCAPSSQ